MVEPTTGQLVGQTKLFAAPKTLSITGAAIASMAESFDLEYERVGENDGERELGEQQPPEF